MVRPDCNYSVFVDWTLIYILQFLPLKNFLFNSFFSLFFRIQIRILQSIMTQIQKKYTGYIVYQMLKLRDIAKRDAFFTIHICNIIHNKIMAYKENKLSEFITTCMIFATHNFSIHSIHYNIILSNIISLKIKFINNVISC